MVKLAQIGLTLTICGLVSTTIFAKDLVIGHQDLDPAAAQKLYGPIATGMSGAIGAKVSTKTYRFPSGIDQDIQDQKVDITINTPYNLGFVDSKHNMEPTVNIWKNGTEYHEGCLATLAGKTADLKSIKGKKVVFEEPFSTGSFAMPFQILTKYVSANDVHLITPEESKKAGGASAMDGFKNYKLEAGKVGLVLSGNDEKSPDYLKLSDDFTLAGMACKTADELKLNIIERSLKTPRIVVSFNKSVDAPTRKKIVAWLVTLNKESPEFKPIKGSAAKELTSDQIKMTTDAMKALAGATEFVQKNISQK